MVRNESKIMKRCLESAMPHVDAVIVVDTGSDDNTINVAKQNCTQPLKIVQHTWKDFGHNRTLSFQAAVQYAEEMEWDLQNSWVVCQDADMHFQNNSLCQHIQNSNLDCYRLVQKCGDMEYVNVRVMRLSCPWQCIGVTHEYWSSSSAFVEDCLKTLEMVAVRMTSLKEMSVFCYRAWLKSLTMSVICSILLRHTGVWASGKNPEVVSVSV